MTLVMNAARTLVADDAARGAPSAADRHLLVLRFALFNLAAFGLVGPAYAQGWIDAVLEADGTGLSVAIFVVFLGGLATCAGKVWCVSRELECVRTFNPCCRSWAATYLEEVAGREPGSRAITGAALRLRIATRIAVVRHVANSLVLLGLIGTVLGFIIAVAFLVNLSAWQVFAGKTIVGWKQSLARLPLRCAGYGTRGSQPLAAAHGPDRAKMMLFVSSATSLEVFLALTCLLVRTQPRT